MLDWTRIRAGKLNLPVKAFSLDELLSVCQQLVRHLVSRKSVALVADAQPRGLWLSGSAFHLQQLLLNLLTNACKYTEQGFVRLTARALEDKDEDADADADADEDVVRVLFVVEDTGQGVRPSHRQRIFESYAEITLDIASRRGRNICRRALFR